MHRCQPWPARCRHSTGGARQAPLPLRGHLVSRGYIFGTWGWISVDPHSPTEHFRMMKCSLSTLSSMVGASHVWLLSPWNVTSWLNFNLNSSMGLAVTESTAGRHPKGDAQPAGRWDLRSQGENLGLWEMPGGELGTVGDVKCSNARGVSELLITVNNRSLQHCIYLKHTDTISQCSNCTCMGDYVKALWYFPKWMKYCSLKTGTCTSERHCSLSPRPPQWGSYQNKVSHTNAGLSQYIRQKLCLYYTVAW